LEYPKINTIWKRDENDKFNIIEGDYSCPEFDAIKTWHITEKIDGTNIRVIFDRSKNLELKFLGKTDKSEIPLFLIEYLKQAFDKELFIKQFPDFLKVVLYGEGYGNRIQSVGKKYRGDASFILFDTLIDGWWLEPDKTKALAKELNIDYVPELGIMTKEKTISLVQHGFPSALAKQNLNAEGVVARSYPFMLFRNGKPITWKLKSNDYIKLEQTKGQSDKPSVVKQDKNNRLSSTFKERDTNFTIL